MRIEIPVIVKSDHMSNKSTFNTDNVGYVRDCTNAIVLFCICNCYMYVLFSTHFKLDQLVNVVPKFQSVKKLDKATSSTQFPFIYIRCILVAGFD